MAPLKTSDLLPVITADVADVSDRDLLEAVAFAEGDALVPLTTAPIDASQHVLEVHWPGCTEPLTLFAIPLGPPTADGFPLKLRLSEPAPSGERKVEAPRGRLTVRGRSGTTATERLTAQHAAELAGPAVVHVNSTASLLHRGLAGGKLTLEEVIGEGGAGAVFRARHRDLQKDVAVKVLHESFQTDIEFCERFHAEALAASQLDHPGLTRVLDFGQEPDGLLYLAMEFLDGEELRHVLDREGALQLERIVHIMLQVCAALGHAHVRGVVHRDVKPENVVLVAGHDDDGRPIEAVKVCDFGIALRRADDAATAAIAGTPEYMSPEQCRGQELDARSDVYACGVMMYEMATGTLPFGGEDVMAIVRRQVKEPPAPPSRHKPDIHPGLEKLIMRTLEKDRTARPDGMRALRAELKLLIEAPPQSLQRPDTPFEGFTRGSMIDDVKRGPGTEAQGATEGWLTGVDAFTSFFEELGSSTQGLGVGAVGESIATRLCVDADGWLAAFAAQTDKQRFQTAAVALGAAINVLVGREELVPLAATLDCLLGLAADTSAIGRERAVVARAMLPAFGDTALLAVAAQGAIGARHEALEAGRRLLAYAGTPGAYALYGARARAGATADGTTRASFVGAMHAIGPRAWPVLRAALEKYAPGQPVSLPHELAADLLSSVPKVEDETGGRIVSQYLRGTPRTVYRAAALALARVWGMRALPLLVGLLGLDDDSAKTAGVLAICELRAVDEHVIRKLAPSLDPRSGSSIDLRSAAAAALGQAQPAARRIAVSALTSTLTGLLGLAKENQLSAADMPITASVARSLVALGGKDGRELVERAHAHAPEAMRVQLAKALG